MMIQQGDVCVESCVIPEGPEGVKMKRGLVLAEGEATGHCHKAVPCGVADAQLFEIGQQLFLRIQGGNCRVIHEEHGEQVLPPGDYEISRIKEYDYDTEEARNVKD